MWGEAGGPGQGLRRFIVEGGPTPSIPLWAAGSMVSSVPAFLMGPEGSAFRYGTFVAGGTRNLISNGEVLYPVPGGPDTQVLNGLFLGGTHDVFADAFYAFTTDYQFETSVSFSLIVNGEVTHATTDGTNYGASAEPFDQAGASTVSVVHLSNLVTGNGTTFTTDALTGPYLYTPSGNNIIPGDIIGIGAPGSRVWYRIVAVNAAAGAGALTIFPVYQGATAASLPYIVIRTGYGSTSRLVYMPDYTTPTSTFFYYVGNRRNSAHEGYIQAVNPNNAVHVMGPQTATASTDVFAVDIAYYKGFLLYGVNGAIGWSIAGFPTVIPFGTGDFPANNLTVVDNQDTFVSFEYLGDQLIAIFRKGIWLVQATGIVPEFNFYKLPEAIGAITQGIVDPEVVTSISYTRPSTTGRGAAYYVAIDGLRQLTGGISGLVSAPIANLNAVIPNELFRPGSCLSWEPTTDSVLWRPGGPSPSAALFDVPHKSWSILQNGPVQAPVNFVGLTAGVTLSPYSTEPMRVQRFGGWANGFLFAQKLEFDIDQTTGTFPWLWASPIIDMGAIYASFEFGGFLVMARAALGASSPSLAWALYSGASPYSLTLKKTSTLDYTVGFTDTRQVIGQKLDDAYAAIVLSGSSWIELSGILALSSESAARR